MTTSKPRILFIFIVLFSLSSCGINSNSEIKSIAESEMNICNPYCDELITLFDSLSTEDCFKIGKNHKTGDLYFYDNNNCLFKPNFDTEELKDFIKNRNIEGIYYYKNHLLILYFPYRNNSLNYFKLVHLSNGIEDLEYRYDESKLKLVQDIDSLNNNWIYLLNKKWAIIISDDYPSCSKL